MWIYGSCYSFYCFYSFIFFFFFFPLSDHIHLEPVVGCPVAKSTIRERGPSSSLGLWGGSLSLLKPSIVWRASAPSTRWNRAAAATSRWHRSQHRGAQRKQHTVLIFWLHAVRQSSSTTLGAANCLRIRVHVVRLITCPFVVNKTNKEKCSVMQRWKLVSEIFRGLMKSQTSWPLIREF